MAPLAVSGAINALGARRESQPRLSLIKSWLNSSSVS
jgi:hypothetical protein